MMLFECVFVGGGGADKNLAASKAFGSLQPLFSTKHAMSNGYSLV